MSEQDLRRGNESHRTRAGLSLRNAESRLIGLSGSALIGDERSLVTEASDATLDVLGYPRNEIACIAGAPV